MTTAVCKNGYRPNQFSSLQKQNIPSTLRTLYFWVLAVILLVQESWSFSVQRLGNRRHINDKSILLSRTLGLRYQTKFQRESALFAGAEVEGSTDVGTLEKADGIHWLQQRYDLPEGWVIKDTVNFRQVRSASLDKLETTALWLQNRLLLSDSEMKRVLRRNPAVLCVSVSENLVPTVNFFIEELEMDERSLAVLVTKHPTLLCMGIKDGQALQRKIRWLNDRLLFEHDKRKLAKIVQKAPMLLTLSVHDNLGPTLDKLQERLSLTDTELAKLVVGAPTCLNLNYASKLDQKLDWLQERLSLTNTQLAKLIVRSPTCLTLSCSSNLSPKLDWLEEKFGWDDQQLGQTVMKHSYILTSSLDALESNCVWFQAHFHWDLATLGRVLRRAPALITPNTDVLEQRAFWLMTRLKTDKTTVSIILQKRPEVLCRSVECLDLKLQGLERYEELLELVLSVPALLNISIPNNVEPTLSFFEQTFGNENIAKSFVKRNPVSMTYSLDKRLTPRLEQAKSAGLDTTQQALVRKMVFSTGEKWDAFMEANK